MPTTPQYSCTEQIKELENFRLEWQKRFAELDRELAVRRRELLARYESPPGKQASATPGGTSNANAAATPGPKTESP